MAIALALVIVAVITAEGLVASSSGPAPPTPALRVSVLDVGQGDAILLEPRDGEPVLVDAGPAQADVATALSERGIDGLGALVVTHPQSDHVGGVPEILTRIEVERLLYARTGGTLRGIARGAGAEPMRIAAGSQLRSGSLRIETLWPPPRVSSAAGDDPNRLSLVLLVRWRGFELLLTGDAEAEVAPLDPGPVDVLKLAHHGSEDTGLDRLLDVASPRLGLISVGADNPYGHPAPETLAELDAAGVPILRTDSAGTVTIEVDRGGWAVK